jgi:hypothetical protein
VVLRIPATPTRLPQRDSHPLWSTVPGRWCRQVDAPAGPPTPPTLARARFGLLPVRSPLLRESRLISLVGLLRCFSSPTALHCPMDSDSGLQPSRWRGCPIRILKAHRLCAAPLERFAGLRVLLRTSAPRHPPRTLSSLSLAQRGANDGDVCRGFSSFSSIRCPLASEAACLPAGCVHAASSLQPPRQN